MVSPEHRTRITSASSSSTDDHATFGFRLSRGTRLCGDPLIHLLPSFLSEAACSDLIALAAPRVRRVETAGRRATVAWIAAIDDSSVASLVVETAGLLSVPPAHIERVQFVRYDASDAYEPHLDTYDANTAEGRTCRLVHGERIATALLYLSDVTAGGETFFPALGLEVRPLRGALLVFRTCKGATDVPDPRTIHTGRPVVKGEKWIANLWFHSSPYRG